MAVPVSFYSETIADNTVKLNGQPESSTWQVATVQLSAANVVAQTALLAALSTAVQGVTIGNLLRTQVLFNKNEISSAAAAVQAAQRENKLLLRYHGATSNQKFNVSIPTFDLTLLPNHSEFLDLTAGVGLALKDAFEDVVRSPNDSSEVVILDTAQFVGRNT